MPQELAPVVTVTPTVMDGTVVRWYASTTAAANYNEIVSASRNGVSVNVHVNGPGQAAALLDLITRASNVASQLCRREDVRHLATHTRDFPSGVVRERVTA